MISVMQLNTVTLSDAVTFLSEIENEKIDMIYVDPPFCTGNKQVSARTGLKYEDNMPREDYLHWCHDWVEQCHRVLKLHGTLYLHLDERMAAHVRCFVTDPIFGDDNRLNTIIWSYDYGGRGKDRFPNKHDIVLVYVKDMKTHFFDWEAIDRIPYMAPGLQKDKERAERGKVPTDVWWMSIVGTQSKERVGYPTQKPVKFVERTILASCPQDGIVLDCFCGSGTTAIAAKNLGRSYIVADCSQDAVDMTLKRLSQQ
jgi:site-specific DNA-methyltransferase (adenine-specific)